MTAEQLDMLAPTTSQQFDAWVHTDFGRWIAENFIRQAYTYHIIRGKWINATFIWELVRHIYVNSQWDDATRPAPEGEWAMNNNYRPHMARFAEKKEPRLQGCFARRQVDKPKKSRPVFVASGTVIAEGKR